MRQGQPLLLLAIALSASLSRAEALPPRPDLNTTDPIATCELQTLTLGTQPTSERTTLLYSLQPPAEDPLANYERTPLGDWQLPAAAERSDPWLRLLLVAPKRPVVIDLAVFIDGRAFRENREGWLDEVIAAAKTQADGEKVEGNKAEEAAGTNGTDEASVDDASGAAAEDSPPQPNGSTVATQSRQAPTMRERLMSYLATGGGEVEREELQWLLAEWGAGPAVVVLERSLSWQRASLAPLVANLDQDANGRLSATEIAQADSVMRRADTDGNDVVDVSELGRQSDRPVTSTGSEGHSLVVLLDANTDWEWLSANLSRAYAAGAEVSTGALPASSIKDRIAQGDATIAAGQLQELCSVPADITLKVDFRSDSDKENQINALSLLAVAPELATGGDAAVVATTDVISVAAGGDFVEISAAQQDANKDSASSVSQIAIGAVVDGNPLERLLDRDQDGRFTHRERQELGGLVAALDRNQDGEVARDEIPVPIRLAVTLGPQVHQLLRAPTGSARTIAPKEAAPAPPDWFISMDKNGDRDLARGEFLGTTEQFRQFDTDGDSLLSVQEAIKLNDTQ
jgi:hypothetical protein